MIILGIDPGSRKTGYGLIERSGKRVTYLDSGVLSFDSETEINKRLGFIYDKSLELIERFQPDHISIESLIFVKSPTALIKLAQARGAMMAAFMRSHKNETYEYSPNLIKSSVCGHGHSDKEAIKKALNMIIGQRDYKAHDESDALAIAICHAVNYNKLNAQKLDFKNKEKKTLYKQKRTMSASLLHKIKRDA